MLTNFKSQFIWCIICTFVLGIIIGIDASLIEFKQPIEEIIGFGIFGILLLIVLILYWANIFHRLDLQDRINSIYTDID